MPVHTYDDDIYLYVLSDNMSIGRFDWFDSYWSLACSDKTSMSEESAPFRQDRSSASKKKSWQAANNQKRLVDYADFNVDNVNFMSDYVY